MEYCRGLNFDQTPNYRELRRLFKQALEERVGLSPLLHLQGFRNDGVYDWVNTNERFDESKLPKHCLNAKGLILDELKRPAPPEFREMYKEGRSRSSRSPRGLSRQVRPHALLAARSASLATPADGAAPADAAARDGNVAGNPTRNAADAATDDVHAAGRSVLAEPLAHTAVALQHVLARDAALLHADARTDAAGGNADATDASVLRQLRDVRV